MEHEQKHWVAAYGRDQGGKPTLAYLQFDPDTFEVIGGVTGGVYKEHAVDFGNQLTDMLNYGDTVWVFEKDDFSSYSAGCHGIPNPVQGDYSCHDIRSLAKVMDAGIMGSEVAEEQAIILLAILQTISEGVRNAGTHI